MGPPTLWPHSWGAVLAVLGGATGPNEMRAELAVKDMAAKMAAWMDRGRK